MTEPVSPTVAHTRDELAKLLAEHRGGAQMGAGSATGHQVAFVPTMGALHRGHAALLQEGRERAADGVLVASVFVNPLQFAAGEDLDRYPRDLATDLEVCSDAGVDVVFAPDVDEVYPGGVSPAEVERMVTVDPGPLSDVLEGKARPGHFRGVLTVVAKLLGLVRPDVVVLGEKDYQQLVLVRQMVRDLCLDVEVVGASTVREPDGLALSSRNRFLDDEQRLQAAAVHQVLVAAQEGVADGVPAARAAARAELRAAVGVDLDYLALTTPDLEELPEDARPGTVGRALIAARVGPTRLIDNLPLTVGESTPGEARPSEARQ